MEDITENAVQEKDVFAAMLEKAEAKVKAEEEAYQEKLERVIQYNNAFKQYCTDNFEAAQTDVLVAAKLLLKIYNYKIRCNKPMKHTIQKWLPHKYEQFMKYGIINVWYRKQADGKEREEFYVDKEKLESFIDFLESKSN